MCYHVVSGTKPNIQYAMHYGSGIMDVLLLEKELNELGNTLSTFYHANGYVHPKLLVFTNDLTEKPQAIRWGLIPFWCKNSSEAMKIQNSTLNARSESIFLKPAFRNSAKSRRCIILVDAFYEHHHAAGRTFPFHISLVDDSPMSLAGLWDEWVDSHTGEVMRTCTILTCKGNQKLSRIHNNPKSDGSRMPVILNKDLQHQWLDFNIRNKEDEEALLEFAKPFPDELIKFKSVRKLMGKGSTGNVPEAEEEFIYKELSF